MCTLSVITGANGYLLAMNRDERIARGAGQQAEIHEHDGTKAIYPREPTGGTWIAVNEHGVGLGLLNSNDIPTQPHGETQSRGQVIPVLSSASGLAELQAGLSILALGGIRPFRLVGVVPSEKAIGMWRWDSVQLMFQAEPWHARHWFSSSLSDSDAERARGIACLDAQHQPDAGSASWLRRLHASHSGGPGPFSLCVHRDGVETLSYSEVVVTLGMVQMGHFRGSPCTMGQIHPIAIERVGRPSLVG